MIENQTEIGITDLRTKNTETTDIVMKKERRRVILANQDRKIMREIERERNKDRDTEKEIRKEIDITKKKMAGKAERRITERMI